MIINDYFKLNHPYGLIGAYINGVNTQYIILFLLKYFLNLSFHYQTELLKLLDKLRSQDIILVTDLTRLSRSTKDLFSLVEQIEKKGVNIKNLKESWL